jgi:tetratricopeptide (TPR) repeat protein
MKRYDEALGYYQRAFEVAKWLQFKGGGAVVLGNMGAIYVEMGKPKDAEKLYRKALELDPKNKEYRAALKQLGAK